MILEEYKKKYNYSSKEKALKSLEYVDEKTQCPYCKKFEISENAVGYYIPDKRIMKNSDYRKYYYVLEAISNKQVICEKLTGLNDDECKTILTIFKEMGFVRLIVGKAESSLDYKDYIVAPAGIEWKNKKTKQRIEILLMAFNTLSNVSTIAKEMFVK